MTPPEHVLRPVTKEEWYLYAQHAAILERRERDILYNAIERLSIQLMAIVSSRRLSLKT